MAIKKYWAETTRARGRRYHAVRFGVFGFGETIRTGFSSFGSAQRTADYLNAERGRILARASAAMAPICNAFGS